MAKSKREEQKLSDALLKFASPLLESLAAAPESSEFDFALSLAQVTWNAVVIERSGLAPQAVKQCLASLKRTGLGADRLEILESMAAGLVAVPEFDRRVIVGIERFSGVDGEPRVRVHGGNLDDLDLDEIASRFAQPSKCSAPKKAAARKSRSAAKEAGSWRALYAQAKELHTLAPWDWLLDRDTFGVRLAGDEEIHWCSVMGAGGEFFGVALYRGDDGFAVLRGLLEEADTELAMCGFDGYLFTYVDRDMLARDELERIKASGQGFRGRSAWPQLEESKYGRLPRVLPAETASRATTLLDLVARGALAMREDSKMPLGDLAADLPVFEFIDDVLVRGSARPRPPAAPTFPAVDRIAVTRLKAQARPVPESFELDWFSMQARVDDEQGWEYAPVMLAVVESRTGHPFMPQLEQPERRFETCAKHFLSILGQAGVLPAELRVRRAWLQQAMAPTAAALGIQLTMQSELPAIDELRASMDSLTGA